MTDKSLPEWLPAGWTVEFKARKTGGRQIPYYVNLETGQGYFSKDAVLRQAKRASSQLKDLKTPPVQSERPSENGDVQTPEKATERPKWLPDGWIVELRTNKSGAAEGRRYKVYVDPLTGFKCYSKPGVLRFLKGGKQISRGPKYGKLKHGKSKRRKSSTKGSGKPVTVEKSQVEDLPPGWIKEIKRRSDGKMDPYYIDPASGYVFRSKKAVRHYLETGERSVYAFLPKGSVSEQKPLPADETQKP